ncbi:hypothetical protein N1851_014133 [Merluccius polli]|uniref:Uncharacterized protein n=1 Tax=Merluccius polli TaxID=89951 RepID=A0AA47MUU0_MERPO|nr:hypothetical protein N1851_014133 [Merluccius polli]
MGDFGGEIRKPIYNCEIVQRQAPSMAQDGILGQLREFVDFICGCDATMVYIKALEILMSQRRTKTSTSQAKSRKAKFKSRKAFIHNSTSTRILEYALLDSQCATAFILSEVAEALEQDKLKLYTTSRTTSTSTKRSHFYRTRSAHWVKLLTSPTSKGSCCIDLGWSNVGHGNPCVDYGDAIGISHVIVAIQVTPGVEPSVNLKTKVHYWRISTSTVRHSTVRFGSVSITTEYHIVPPRRGWGRHNTAARNCQDVIYTAPSHA